MYSVLLDLWEEHQVAIVTRWLDWKGMATLDTALCSPLRRSAFWKLVSSTGVVLDSISRFKDNKIPLRWVMQKGLKVRALEVGLCTMKDGTLMESLLSHCGQELSSLTLNTSYERSKPPGAWFEWFASDPMMLQVAKQCRNIRRLTLIRGGYTTSITFTALPQSLQTLHLDGVTLTADVLRAIRSVLSLTDLSVVRCGNRHAEPDPELYFNTIYSLACENVYFCQFFPMLTRLQAEHVPLSNASVRLIADSCKYLKHLTMLMGEELDISTAEYVASQWPQLEDLKIINCSSTEIVPVFERLCPMLSCCDPYSIRSEI